MKLLSVSVIVGCGLVMGACAESGDGVDLDGPALPEAPAASPDGVPQRTAGWAQIDSVPYEPEVVAADDRIERAPLTLTREELARALRPVMSTGAGTRIAREPNWAAADALLRSGASSMAYDSGVSGEGPDGGTMGAARILGADNRFTQFATTAAPYSSMTQIWIALDGGTSQCTGTYIGPWTFVTAGHCLRLNSGQVARSITFNAGRSGGSFPFGSISCSNDDANPNNDFFAAIPAQYAATADSNWDFAVIDTWPCHVAQRWLGMPASNQGVWVDSGNGTYTVNSYSGSACSGSTGWDFNCQMSGNAYVNGNWLETDVIDTDGGQSGGPWHWGGRVAATHIGYREYFDLFRCGFSNCQRNFSRRIDGAYKSFLDAVAYDYP